MMTISLPSTPAPPVKARAVVSYFAKIQVKVVPKPDAEVPRQYRDAAHGFSMPTDTLPFQQRDRQLRKMVC